MKELKAVGSWDIEECDDLAIVGDLKALYEESFRIYQEVLYALDPMECYTPLSAKLVEVASRVLQLADFDIHLGQDNIDDSLRVTNAADAILHSEIRRIWREDSKGSNNNYRLEVEDLTLDELYALATGPSYLSGLSESNQKLARDKLAWDISPAKMHDVLLLTKAKLRALMAMNALDQDVRKLQRSQGKKP